MSGTANIIVATSTVSDYSTTYSQLLPNLIVSGTNKNNPVWPLNQTTQKNSSIGTKFANPVWPLNQTTQKNSSIGTKFANPVWKKSGMAPNPVWHKLTVILKDL